jgi:hypothetical protein
MYSTIVVKAMIYLDPVVITDFTQQIPGISSRGIFVVFTMDKAEICRVFSHVAVTIDTVCIGRCIY